MHTEPEQQATATPAEPEVGPADAARGTGGAATAPADASGPATVAAGGTTAAAEARSAGTAAITDEAGSAGTAAAADDGGFAGARDADWPLAATRWAQITLAEDDPEHFDADFWFDLMRDSKSNATCISAGGYIAYYPTQLEYHYRSKYLGDTDPFGTLVDGARSLGMSVMARVDPHAIHADAATAHP